MPTTPDRQVAGGVTAYAQATITTQGTVSASTVATNMAINGDGFFSVQKPTGTVDNTPVFNGVTDYTRRGDFQVNANGNLVNGAGYYLMGVAVDPKTGNPLGSVPQVLQFQNNFIPAQATSAIQYAANLPTTPDDHGEQHRCGGRHAYRRGRSRTPPTSARIRSFWARRQHPMATRRRRVLPRTTRHRRLALSRLPQPCPGLPQATLSRRVSRSATPSR